jgi:hypothetical protein
MNTSECFAESIVNDETIFGKETWGNELILSDLTKDTQTFEVSESLETYPLVDTIRFGSSEFFLTSLFDRRTENSLSPPIDSFMGLVPGPTERQPRNFGSRLSVSWPIWAIPIIVAIILAIFVIVLVVHRKIRMRSEFDYFNQNDETPTEELSQHEISEGYFHSEINPFDPEVMTSEFGDGETESII